jgi:ribose-phosphate pyrophosphokinase
LRSLLIAYVSQIAILVDDMIDTGRTVSLAARLLKEAGAKEIYVIVSHGKSQIIHIDSILTVPMQVYLPRLT